MLDRRQLVAGAVATTTALALPTQADAASAHRGATPQPSGDLGRAPGDAPGRLAIGYDTGFYSGGTNTHEPFLSHEVHDHMARIHHELNSQLVRVTGGNQDRLEYAARAAAERGLGVWYSPFTTDLTQDEMVAFLNDSAARAEKIRGDGSEVVLVAGAEISLFVQGFLPGTTFHDRLAFLTTPSPERGQVLAELPAKMNAFFARVLPGIRSRFHGPVAYAGLSFETIDWTPFDYLGHDFYPTMVDGAFPGAEAVLQSLSAHGKPVAITEFGCPTFDGASAAPGQGAAAVVFDGHTTTPLSLANDYVRDETEQTTYLGGLMDLFDAHGIDIAFVHTFAQFHLPTRRGPRQDLDLASYGVEHLTQRDNGRQTMRPKESARMLARRLHPGIEAGL